MSKVMLQKVVVFKMKKQFFWDIRISWAKKTYISICLDYKFSQKLYEHLSIMVNIKRFFKETKNKYRLVWNCHKWR